jgi:hypothetical protein
MSYRVTRVTWLHGQRSEGLMECWKTDWSNTPIPQYSSMPLLRHSTF